MKMNHCWSVEKAPCQQKQTCLAMIATDSGGHLITGQRLTGMESGRIFTQAFVWNVRDCLLMRRKKTLTEFREETEDSKAEVKEFRCQLNPNIVGRGNKWSRTKS
jgi:hypothetical protein